jgi:type VI secretion system protein ImpL
MARIFRSSTGRTLLIAIGILCLSLLVWFGTPYVGFESVVGRLLIIMAIILVWTIVLMIRQLRERRADAVLAEGAATDGATAAAGRRSGGASAVSSDARALRECFAEAAEFLRKSGSARGSLYELPWYAIIGPPGTGKTTLIEKSGLRFPVAQRAGSRKVTGVGGTRNCQWWFTDEAILLDTAGRFTTQDSNAAVDRDGWIEFLGLLHKYRRRQPLNGLFVAFSAADLISKTAEALDQDALIIRERLDEIQKALRISLPVYFLVTQCDLISGFTEFFDDLDQDARKQVLGFTFAFPESQSGAGVDRMDERFKELADRLSSRLITNLNKERDLERRVALMVFPAQFASLRSRLEAFTKEVFSSGRFDRRLWLRGVYFTSGTQVGAPIDRMMAAVAKEFGFTNQVSDRHSTAGRAFFSERVLRTVVFPESGLAGVNRRLEIGKAALQLSAYIACLAVAGIAIVWLTVSYARNSSYLQDVNNALTRFNAGQATSTSAAGMDQVLPRLDALHAVVDVAERHGDRRPWSMRFFLYQPNGMGEDARAAYVRVVNDSLLPVLSVQLRDRLARVAAEPEDLFESLKAYLLLSDHSHIDGGKTDLADVARMEWVAQYGADPSAPVRLSAHLQALLDSEQALAAPPDDKDTVARARASLAGLTPKRLIYARIARLYSADPSRGFRLNIEAGLDSDKVFLRRSGRALDEPLPYLYTRPAFEEISTLAAGKATMSFLKDFWVFGDSHRSLADQARLPFDVVSVYEDDYIAKWDALLGDIALKPIGKAEVPDALRILSEPDSPLRNLVTKVADNTNLVKPNADAKAGSPLAQLESGGAGMLAKGVAAAQAQLGGGTAPPGTRITDHFRPVFTAGAAIDKCLGALGQIALQLNTSAGLINGNPAGALNQGGAVDLAHGLELCTASLPAPLNGMMKQASAAGQSVAVAQVGAQLADRVSQMVNPDCKEVVGIGYPFRNTPTDEVPLADFGRVFGLGGSFDVFFRDNLVPLVDIRDSGMRWREVSETHITMPATVLPAFERAKRIRDAFFAQGGQQPHVDFTLTPDTVSLDPDVVRFVLEIDGQKFEDRHDPPVMGPTLHWPGPAPGLVSFRFEDRNGNGPSISNRGAWAWFRILDGAQLDRLSSTTYRITLRAGEKKERVLLTATSIRNPFERNLLNNFRCPN